MISEKIYLDNTNDERTTNERRELDKYNKKVTGASKNYFVVFRIGKKFKNFSMIQAYERHVNREGEVLNADFSKTKFNRVLIGSKNISLDIKEYIKDVPFIRSNGNIAFDIVLTVHHEFFETLAPQEKEKWINHNVEYLKNTFGDNCVSSILHADESSLHLHNMIVPKFWNEKQKRYELQSNEYLDGKNKLREFQDSYADHMHKEFNNLIRGIRGSPILKLNIFQYKLITAY